MQTHLTSSSSTRLNSKVHSHLVTFSNGHLVKIFLSTFSRKRLGLVTLLTVILFLDSKFIAKTNVKKVHIIKSKGSGVRSGPYSPLVLFGR